MPVIYDEFKLPNHCLINKPIPKDIFLEYGKMTEKNKERFNKYFKSARIIYSLKYNDLKLKPITIGKTDYNELHILEVSVLTNKIPYFDQLSFVRDIVQGMPYPVLFVMKFGAVHYKFFSTQVHIGTLDSYKSIVEKIKHSDWIWYDKNHLHSYDTKFLHNMLVYFYKSNDFYNVCNNFITLFEKHYEISKKQKEIDYINKRLNGYSSIQQRVESEKHDNTVLLTKYPKNKRFKKE